jgi:hypothetical protein
MTYIVWCPDLDETKEEGRAFTADCPATACEKWAERHDWESAEYAIVGGQAARAMVVSKGSDMPPLHYIVSGEATPRYTAIKE